MVESNRKLIVAFIKNNTSKITQKYGSLKTSNVYLSINNCCDDFDSLFNMYFRIL